jgi:predicted DNA-binding transcriptional regulator AlpA
MSGEPLLLDAKSAAALCSVSRATWWAWLRTGRCPPPIRIGERVVRWSAETIRQWVAAGCPRQHEGRR